MSDDGGADSLQPAAWHEMEAWTLESESLRVVVTPALGAKIVSLFDKRSAVEWLAGSGARPVQPVAYGADFERQDMSGWDEMFPTISACTYPGPGARCGASLPDHGEVWALPWLREPAGPGALRLSVEGRALPYRLTRTLRFAASDTLAFDYHLHNWGPDPMPYIWAAHPQFACGNAAQIVLPPHIRQVCNVLPPEWGWGEEEAVYDWPTAQGETGAQQLARTGPPSLAAARKFYVLPDDRTAWAALVRQPQGDWLRLAWDTDSVPYFGLWIDEGALHHQSVAAPEPTTGFYDSLALAWAKGQVLTLEPGAAAAWTLTVQVGSGPLVQVG